MIWNFLNKTFNKVQESRGTQPPIPGNRLLTGNRAQRRRFLLRNKFLPPYQSVQNVLEMVSRRSAFQKNILSISLSRLNRYRLAKNKEERLNACKTVALNGRTTLVNLPDKFAGDEGIWFFLLIVSTRQEKRRKKPADCDFNRVTSLEVWDHKMNYENTPGQYAQHTASFFSGYSEKEFRMLSKDWLQVTFTPRSIANHL